MGGGGLGGSEGKVNGGGAVGAAELDRREAAGGSTPDGEGDGFPFAHAHVRGMHLIDEGAVQEFQGGAIPITDAPDGGDGAGVVGDGDGMVGGGTAGRDDDAGDGVNDQLAFVNVQGVGASFDAVTTGSTAAGGGGGPVLGGGIGESHQIGVVVIQAGDAVDDDAAAAGVVNVTGEPEGIDGTAEGHVRNGGGGTGGKHIRIRPVQNIHAGGIGLVVAGIHVIIDFLIAVDAIALIFDVMVERTAGTAFPAAVGHEDADAATGGAIDGEEVIVGIAVVFGAGLAVGVAINIMAFNITVVAVVIGVRGAVGDDVVQETSDEAQLADIGFGGDIIGEVNIIDAVLDEIIMGKRRGCDGAGDAGNENDVADLFGGDGGSAQSGGNAGGRAGVLDLCAPV